MEQMIAVRQFTDESGTSRRFRYYLLTRQAGAAPFCCECYGVRVLEEGGCSAAYSDLTTDPTAMDKLMTLLVDGLVGPTTLGDVVEDFLELTVRAGPAFAGA